MESFAFENILDSYHLYRPDYPREMFSDIETYSQIQRDSRILEVGAGTGQATDYFVQNQYTLTALEISEKQTNFLSERYRAFPRVTICQCPFENFQAENLDLILAASSFHWIDSAVRYRKAYVMLRPGGTLVQCWHMHPVQKNENSYGAELDSIYASFFPDRTFFARADFPAIFQKRINQLQDNGFVQIVLKQFSFSRIYSAKEYLQLLSTYSYIQKLEKRESFFAHIANCIERNGGTINTVFHIHLYLSRKPEFEGSDYHAG